MSGRLPELPTRWTPTRYLPPEQAEEERLRRAYEMYRTRALLGADPLVARDQAASWLGQDDAIDSRYRQLAPSLPTRYMPIEAGNDVRAQNAADMRGVRVLMGSTPEVADEQARQYEIEDRTKAENYRRMRDETGRAAPGILGSIDNAVRRLGQQAGFALPDYLEGLSNSLIYGTTFDDAFNTARGRTEDAADDLGPLLTPVLDTVGGLGGYVALGALAPGMFGMGALSAGAPAMEGVRGYLSTPGDVDRRLRAGAAEALNPLNWVNPSTAAGNASIMLPDSVLSLLGADEWSPRAYMQGLFE